MKTQDLILPIAAFAVGAMIAKQSPAKVSGIGALFPNYHVLKIDFLGPTNTKPSRVKITSERYEESIIISYDHQYNSSKEVAAAWLEKMGFNIIGAGQSKNGYYIISDTFQSLK